MGCGWLLFTVAFEFGFGHYVAGHSWQRLLGDYNIFDGRVWSLFLLWLLLMPVPFFLPGKARGLTTPAACPNRHRRGL